MFDFRNLKIADIPIRLTLISMLALAYSFSYNFGKFLWLGPSKLTFLKLSDFVTSAVHIIPIYILFIAIVEYSREAFPPKYRQFDKKSDRWDIFWLALCLIAGSVFFYPGSFIYVIFVWVVYWTSVYRVVYYHTDIKDPEGIVRELVLTVLFMITFALNGFSTTQTILSSNRFDAKLHIQGEVHEVKVFAVTGENVLAFDLLNALSVYQRDNIERIEYRATSLFDSPFPVYDYISDYFSKAEDETDAETKPDQNETNPALDANEKQID